MATVRLQYYSLGGKNLTREVTMITLNQGGLFEDMVNTTFLLRIGPWIVNASFPSQLGYATPSTIERFTIVVQPNLSLYLSANNLALRQSVSFDGLMFACIPCINDQVAVVFTRPDNTSVSIPLHVNATGGPYPGGYFEGKFTPDVLGVWHVRAVWSGNEVALSASSQVEGLNVEAPASQLSILPYAAVAIVATGVAILLLKRYRRTRLSST